MADAASVGAISTWYAGQRMQLCYNLARSGTHYAHPRLARVNAGTGDAQMRLHPPGPRDPQGVHGAIWEEIEDDSYRAPADKPLTFGTGQSGPPFAGTLSYLGIS